MIAKKANEIAVAAVHEFGITRIDDGDRLVGCLSGGERQALAIALGGAIYHVHAKDTFLNAPVQATTSLMDIPARRWSYITLGFGHGEE